MSGATRLMPAPAWPTLALTRGVGGGGPCILGGVSPSLHPARQCVTSPLFTGPALTTPARSRFGFPEPKRAGVVVPASSGARRSRDLTKASRPAPLVPVSRRGRP